MDKNEKVLDFVKAVSDADRLREAREGFRPDHPAGILPQLERALQGLRSLPPETQAEPLIQAKAADLAEVIRAAAGLWIEAIADRQRLAPGDRLVVQAAVLARGGAPVGLDALPLRFLELFRLDRVVLEPRWILRLESDSDRYNAAFLVPAS